jgi:RNA polymerase sigma factor (sigma-70 family)
MNLSKGFHRPGRTAMVALMLGAALTVTDSKASAAATSDKAIADIQRYCSACWRNARIPLDSWTDCTQEVLCRLMQRIPLTKWDLVLRSEGDERREFVRAIDAVKKRSQRSRKWAPLNEDVTDRCAISQGLGDRREELNRAAEQVLSVRQRRILQMSMEGYTVQDTADALTMSPERVSDEKYKAIRKLRRELGVEV